ncbi:hypothetical protein BZ13_852 [Francisella philomiragia subsp. philomiragia ATCC 25015]|uniref:hypothetical protein n=1 Tax=Francisella philomiragia TaxID=28110 RepID=UPI0001AF788F|nr:hypothetical protein [Francisella philomiragia]AJI74334.1 hypothetical protein BZ13_852 [Francisella philomiragia subsp. philomiragia ATCC 25015]EET20926.1 predicted protein [Francisella philomiragia subsp. philomiragia ATCC 25015]MBK2238184.1 hypothetical protein [Francisella philomiragia]
MSISKKLLKLKRFVTVKNGKLFAMTDLPKDFQCAFYLSKTNIVEKHSYSLSNFTCFEHRLSPGSYFVTFFYKNNNGVVETIRYDLQIKESDLIDTENFPNKNLVGSSLNIGIKDISSEFGYIFYCIDSSNNIYVDIFKYKNQLSSIIFLENVLESVTSVETVTTGYNSIFEFYKNYGFNHKLVRKNVASKKLDNVLDSIIKDFKKNHDVSSLLESIKIINNKE